jgi:putative copper export protein
VHSLAPALTAVRLSLHVIAAAVFVGGQITMVGLLPDVRKLGGDASVRVARAFAKVSWPAFGVLLLTGIWNVAAVHASNSTHSWSVVLAIKIVIALLAGLAAWLHSMSKSRKSLAIWGSVTGLSSLAALVLGVLLAG